MAIKNSILKQPKNPPRAGFRWLVIIGFIFGELLIYTWVRTESTHTILRLSHVQDAHTKAMSYNKELSVERDRLKSDERITRIAKTRLHLLSDTGNQTIYIAGEND